MKKNRLQKSLEIFGLQAVIDAVKKGKEFDKIFMEKGVNTGLAMDLRTLLKEHNIMFKAVPVEKLNRLTSKDHQGVFAFVSPVNFYPLGEVLMRTYEEGKSPLLLMLDRVTDVRNFGAIARTAEACGVNAIILPKVGGAQLNLDAMKTSTGALMHIPLCREQNLAHSIKYLKKSGLNVVACSEKSESSIYDSTFIDPVVIVMGSEEDGISDEILELSDIKTSIPMFGKTKSLNVSVASAVILYEAIRQRNIES
jgi:23S rRNA (guanosine2251-2'-O)-methyltransferase